MDSRDSDDAQFMEDGQHEEISSGFVESQPESSKKQKQIGLPYAGILEPTTVTIVRGNDDGSTTYYKIIPTANPAGTAIPVGEVGMADGLGKVQLINGALHFPNGTVLAPGAMGELLGTTTEIISGSSGIVKAKKGVVPRDERRRQTHNEVERRRRDKINQWITKLQTLVPNADSSKNGQSKGAILSKAVDYINQLTTELQQAKLARDNNQKMHLLAIENEVYRKQVEVLTKYVQDQGLELPPNMPIAALNALQELQQGTAILIAQQTRAPSNKTS